MACNNVTYLQQIGFFSSVIKGIVFWLLIKLVTTPLLKRYHLNPTNSITQAVVSAPKNLQNKLAKQLGGIFWGMFLTNAALVSGLVVVNNRRTIRRIQQDALEQRIKAHWLPRSKQAYLQSNHR